MEIKDQIKRSVSIVDVASLYVNMKPAGKNFKALCPFHAEKTPSFFVMPEKDTFACYGCNRFGDIFTMVQDMENITFPEAIDFLIDRFHIPIEKKRFSSNLKKDDFLSITKTAAAWFRGSLARTTGGKLALNYLEKRGIDSQTAEAFSLGYAEDSWDGLYNHLKSAGCDIEKSISLGLLVRSDKGKVYDRFRGRLIFPISSESGAVLAFGGRSISEAEPKYLNSPDTPIYKKGQHLFGFHLAKSHIREKNQAILVEGYFDMVTLFQHGVRHVVASLGTALTEQQIYLLKRFAENIYFFYDNDEAGVSATLKGIDRMFEQNINPWILKYDGAKDPDQFIREQGKKALVASLDRASDGVRFILNDVAGKYPLHIPEKKRRAIEIVKISLEKFDDPIVRDGYQRLAADFFNIDPGIIKATLGSGGTLQSDKEGLMITPAEKDFIASILAMPEFIAEIRKLFDDEILAVLVSKNIIRAIFRNFDAKSNEIDFQKVAEKLNEAEKIRFNIIFSGLSEVGAEKKDLIEKIESSFLSFQNVLNNRRIKDINRDIRVASRDGNLAEVKRLMTLKDRFVREKRKHFAGGAVETSQG